MRIISLTQGMITVVDDGDFEWLNQHKWYAKKSNDAGKWYAARSTGAQNAGGTVYMHREILQCSNGMEVDHDNGCSLDNRRCNLKEVTKAENLRNRFKNR